MTHRIISTSNQSLADSITWFEGTKKQCEKVLPRIRQWANKTSDKFIIIKE
tara:strand:+ start:535 stop:687 length:153 start_codon:yes stop_codon:yes gene_type:complete